jgi:hypothetical protein
MDSWDGSIERITQHAAQQALEVYEMTLHVRINIKNKRDCK